MWAPRRPFVREAAKAISLRFRRLQSFEPAVFMPITKPRSSPRIGLRCRGRPFGARTSWPGELLVGRVRGVGSEMRCLCAAAADGKKAAKEPTSKGLRHTLLSRVDLCHGLRTQDHTPCCFSALRFRTCCPEHGWQNFGAANSTSPECPELAITHLAAIKPKTSSFYCCDHV